MTDNTPSDSKMQTNEEIIAELTKDIKEYAVSEHDGSDGKETRTARTSDNMIRDVNKTSYTSDEANEDADEDSSTRADDFIDDVALKDAELTYAEEDKQRLHEQALEMKATGNELFRAGEWGQAAQKYTLALRTCPLAFPADRAALFCNRAACKMKLELLKSGVEDCTEAIALKCDYVKAFLRRAQMYERLEKLDEALADYQEVLKLDPDNKDAYIATVRLPGEINERNEKLKTEMFGKLKELGNMVLRPFGLSTDNFQVNQDPGSGGYSINFKQNPN